MPDPSSVVGAGWTVMALAIASLAYGFNNLAKAGLVVAAAFGLYGGLMS